MPYDVIVVGAGPAGLTAGALLAKEGRRVVVLEASTVLGGRAMEVADEGFRVQVGGHLAEDSGSGITAIFHHLGKRLEHGPVNEQMPVWDHQRGGWGSVRDRYAGSRAELKRVIRALLATPFEELERWDDRPLRDWMLRHTSDDGVIDLFEFLAILECLTYEPWDHAASDNLFMRKWHYAEKGMAGYSFWPGRGWNALWDDLADALRGFGGELRVGTVVDRALVERGRVQGVAVRRQPRVLPNEFEHEVIEAPCVICTLPVWNVLDVVPDHVLPDWYAGQIRFLAQDRFRVSWLGLYLATEEPVAVLDRRELSVWRHDPVAGLPGFGFETSAMDPEAAPPGVFLYCIGGIIPATRANDRRYVEQAFHDLQQGVGEMWPGLARPVWRRRHLVFDPSYAVIQKPGLVGRFRPSWQVPNVEGLYFASETFRSRGIGIDRAARAALTTVETYLGRRIGGLDETWRY